ncbi:hypothetical protein [Novipirellula maiorica]|uniref:hypothetical protein n=1 Tax=Novipirellula maiorica TaxID=1265734 RepID=UPI0005933DBC|nr:hypothetical protein [Rhodopirellula maiorica]
MMIASMRARLCTALMVLGLGCCCFGFTAAQETGPNDLQKFHFRLTNANQVTVWYEERIYVIRDKVLLNELTRRDFWPVDINLKTDNPNVPDGKGMLGLFISDGTGVSGMVLIYGLPFFRSGYHPQPMGQFCNRLIEELGKLYESKSTPIEQRMANANYLTDRILSFRPAVKTEDSSPGSDQRDGKPLIDQNDLPSVEFVNPFE